MARKKSSTPVIVRSQMESRLRVADNSYYEMIYEIISDMIPHIKIPYNIEHVENVLMSKSSYKSTKLEVLEKVIPLAINYCEKQDMNAYKVFKRQISDMYDKILTDEGK